jgi:hypothetical protein
MKFWACEIKKMLAIIQQNNLSPFLLFINLKNKVFQKYNFNLFYVSRKSITLSGANMIVGYLKTVLRKILGM